MERYLLLSFAGRYAVVADDLQLVVERIHPQGHEYRIALHSIRRRLHRLRLVGLEPQTPRRLQRRTQILKTLRRSLDQRARKSDLPGPLQNGKTVNSGFLDKLLQNHRMVLNPVLRGIEQRHIRIGPNAVEKILHGSRTPQLIEVLAPKLRPTACRIPVIPHPQRRRRSDPLRPQIVMKRLFANAPRPSLSTSTRNPSPGLSGRKPVSAVLPYSS